MSEIKNLKMAICFLDENDEVFVQRILEAHWEINIEQDLKMFHNIHMKDEVATILTEQTKLQLDKGAIREMVDELWEKHEAWLRENK